MPTLDAVLTDPALAGLYRVPTRIPTRALVRRATAAGLRPATLHGRAIRDKAGLLRACAAALAFPPYFGRNWDALADCLGDLAWLPEGGHALIYDGPPPLIRHAPADWAMARSIFAGAAEEWGGRGRPFVVLLRGTDSLLPDLPLLVAPSAPHGRRAD